MRAAEMLDDWQDTLKSGNPVNAIGAWFEELLVQTANIESAVQHLADSQGTGPGEQVRAILDGRTE